MKELSGPDKDLFELGKYADAFCITTNGTIKKNGQAVMGRGCALQAKKLWPNLPGILASNLEKNGNVPNLLGSITGFGELDVTCEFGAHLWSFPVKHNWYENADLALIERSANQLVKQANDYRYRIVVLPRPGCSNGHLDWVDVRKVIKPILDKRFVVVSNGS